MPNRDKTGPLGTGPIGRGQGGCNIDVNNQSQGRGRRMCRFGLGALSRRGKNSSDKK